MTPSARLSAPDTPSGKAGDSPTSTASKTTPRKSPTCKTCGQRRAGHPRSGCPTIDTPSKPTKIQEPELTDALQSLRLKSLASDDKATLRARRRSSGIKPVQAASLASLPSAVNEVIDRLLQPGIISDELSDGEGQKLRIERWQETMIPASTKLGREYRLHSLMPGTLNTPSSSFVSQGDIPCESEMIPLKDASEASIATIRPSPSGQKPLVRSMSFEERRMFLDKLAKEMSPAVPATVFQFPLNDIPSIQQSAMKLGFFSRVIPGLDGQTGYLLLGRDSAAVDGLFDGVKEQTKKTIGRGGTGRMGVAAGGAVVGAVATFTGLALS